jgi:Cof subfamily protein (haloacid dehalogenase superfamily)
LEHSSRFYYERNKEVPEEYQFDIRVVRNAEEVVTADSEQATKIVAISADAVLLNRVRREMEAIETVTVTSSDRNNFEVLNRNVSKGKALEYLGRLLNIKPEETVAMGDNENDDSMLQYAGLSIAMGNAENSIKEIADYITLSNDRHGVSEAIKKFLL